MDNIAYPPLFALAGVAALLLTVGFLVRRHLRLRHIPGPFLSTLTDLWLAQKLWRGTFYGDHSSEMHEKYGLVVRLGPNRVSFASAQAVGEIYSTKRVYPKAASYDTMIVVANGQPVKTIVSERDEKRVSSLKRHMLGGWSQNSFLKHESQIDGILVRFLNLLKKSGDGEAVDMSQMLKCWSFDTINRVAFSDDLGFMSGGADIGDTFKATRERFNHRHNWLLLPTLERLIFKNPVVARLPASRSILAGLATKRIQTHIRDSKDLEDGDLLGKFLAASKKDPEAISPKAVLGLTISTIHAGSDTTAGTLAIVLVDLLQYPQAMQKLEAELLENIGVSPSTPPSFNSVANLPYLDAVIKESMRHRSLSEIPREKEIPHGGATICGVYIPEGTDVSICERFTNSDPAVFGKDTSIFKPERWIEASEEQVKNMERHHMGFSQGRRTCIGQHLAKIEMKKMLATLLTTFKILPSEEEPKIRWYMATREISLKVKIVQR